MMWFLGGSERLYAAPPTWVFRSGLPALEIGDNAEEFPPFAVYLVIRVLAASIDGTCDLLFIRCAYWTKVHAGRVESLACRK